MERVLRDTKYDASNSLDEARKLLTAKTKEKIEFGLIESILASDHQAIGSYVHKEIADHVGSSGCYLIVQHDSKGRQA